MQQSTVARKWEVRLAPKSMWRTHDGCRVLGDREYGVARQPWENTKWDVGKNRQCFTAQILSWRPRFGKSNWLIESLGVWSSEMLRTTVAIGRSSALRWKEKPRLLYLGKREMKY